MTGVVKPKSANKVRPIVPQSIFSRLTGKAALRHLRARITTALGPWQTAVNCPSGVEAQATQARLWLEHLG